MPQSWCWRISRSNSPLACSLRWALVESYFAEAFPLVLPINLLVAALTTGVITALLPWTNERSIESNR